MDTYRKSPQYEILVAELPSDKWDSSGTARSELASTSVARQYWARAGHFATGSGS